MRRELITAASVLALMTGAAYAQATGTDTMATDPAAQPQVIENEADSARNDADVNVQVEEGADVTVEPMDDTAATGTVTTDSPTAGTDTMGTGTMATDSAATAGAGAASADQMLGANVVGADGEDLGEVEDVILDASGNAQQLVISSGGFLGIGERQVAVDYSSATWDAAEERVMLSGVTRDQFREMEQFEYSDTTTSLNRQRDAAPAAPGASPGAVPPAGAQ
ncbi:PRC-barrel domain-containing protein [Azospirillum halopraeferens]|uniref:PRC-barrel domain-containing protein n=1 Tax=Azospirillum halopraeferens TaxID=34010 RepID=UPI000402C22C|nr:PRC-barrel domain-containing protein [Azospirillum halopraeferens]